MRTSLGLPSKPPEPKHPPTHIELTVAMDLVQGDPPVKVCYPVALVCVERCESGNVYVWIPGSPGSRQPVVESYQAIAEALNPITIELRGTKETAIE